MHAKTAKRKTEDGPNQSQKLHLMLQCWPNNKRPQLSRPVAIDTATNTHSDTLRHRQRHTHTYVDVALAMLHVGT